MGEYIYIVISQTGTRFSRVLRLFNRSPYNHASLALDSSLSGLYSFGRQCLSFPLIAGFVREQPRVGVYRQFWDTQCAVYQVEVRPESYACLERLIRGFEEEKGRYHYSFLGLLTIWAGVPLHRRHHYVCSQFVAYLLQESGIAGRERDFSLVRPQELAALPGARLVYRGLLNAYSGPDPLPLLSA